MILHDPQGSVWQRWDPHIHAPGTVLADHYRGESAWADFITALEQSDPVIGALGITDYLSVDLYEGVVAEKRTAGSRMSDSYFRTWKCDSVSRRQKTPR